jgi:hypothetical protein
VTRLRLKSVGLSEQLGRNVSYTSRMGSDVAPVLADAQRRKARKSDLSGSGYEGGETATVGASRRTTGGVRGSLLVGESLGRAQAPI